MQRALTSDEAEAAWWRAAQGEDTKDIAGAYGLDTRALADQMRDLGFPLSTARVLARQSQPIEDAAKKGAKKGTKKRKRRPINEADVEYAVIEVRDRKRKIVDVADELNCKAVSLASRLRHLGIVIGGKDGVRTTERAGQVAEVERMIRPIAEGGLGISAAEACRRVGAEYRATMQQISRRRKAGVTKDLVTS